MLNSESIMLALNNVDDEYIIRVGRRLGYIAVEADSARRLGTHRIVTFALAAALLLGLGAAAYAAGIHSGFFKNAFGAGVPGQKAHSFEVISADGGVLKTETLPEIERVDTNDELAEKLIGEYVSAVGQSVDIGNYTVTVREAVMDENGLGAVTVDITNPDGHGFAPDGSFSSLNPEVYLGFSPQFADGTPIAARDYAAAEGYSDTHISFVYYLAPPVTPTRGEDIVLRFSKVLRSSGKRETADIVIPAAECVPTRELRGDDITAALSPVGLRLSFGTVKHDAAFEEYVTRELVIRFTDGEEYTVKGEGVNNAALGTYDTDNVGVHSYVFNRIVDISSAESVFIRTTHYDSQGQEEEMYTPE